MFSLKSLLGVTPEVETAQTLYAATINASREAHFFTVWGLPDTPEGRFEMLALAAFLVLHRLKEIDGGEQLSQAYFDVMFDDVDANLRELGVGDMTVGKKVKKLASSFMGRIKAYDEGLADDGQGLRDALARNLFMGAETAEGALEDAEAYVRGQAQYLASQPDAELTAGNIAFAPPTELIAP